MRRGRRLASGVSRAALTNRLTAPAGESWLAAMATRTSGAGGSTWRAWSGGCVRSCGSPAQEGSATLAAAAGEIREASRRPAWRVISGIHGSDARRGPGQGFELRSGRRRRVGCAGRCWLERHRRAGHDVLAPRCQLCRDAAADVDLRFGGGELVLPFPVGDIAAYPLERVDEVVGVVQRIDQPGLAEVGDVRIAAAAERAAVAACSGEHQGAG